MSDSRKRFEEWHSRRFEASWLNETCKELRYEGWSARDSEVERLREALVDMCAAWQSVCTAKGWEPEHIEGYRKSMALLSSQDKESA